MVGKAVKMKIKFSKLCEPIWVKTGKSIKIEFVYNSKYKICRWFRANGTLVLASHSLITKSCEMEFYAVDSNRVDEHILECESPYMVIPIKDVKINMLNDALEYSVVKFLNDFLSNREKFIGG